MTTFNSTYVLNSAAARRELDLQFRSAFLAWGEQTAKVTGTGQVDAVYGHAGVSVDFTASGASVDTLYLDGVLTDYTVTVLGSVLTLSRAASGSGPTLVPASTYKLTIEAGATGDAVVFANGATTALALSGSVAAVAAVPVVLNAATTSLSAPAILAGALVANDTVRVRLDSQGSVVTTVGEPMVIIAGSSAIDVVYVNAGSQVDARGLGGSSDQIYLTGNWADYAKTINGKSIEFTRIVGGNTERVLVSGGSGVLNDQLFFADGNVMSNAAFINIIAAADAQAIAALNLFTAGGNLDTTSGNHTPIDNLALGKVISISSDSGAVDLVTSNPTQTINGTYQGVLRTGDKLQVQVAGGAWTDVTTVTATSAQGGTFTLTGITLAQGNQTVSVRTVGLESNLGLNANANTTNTRIDSTLNKTIILDTSLPSGTLLANGAGLAADTYVGAAEDTVLLKISTASLNFGDAVQLRVGGVNKGGVFSVNANDLAAGFILVSVAKGDLDVGANSVTAVFSDVAGNTSTSTAYTLTKDIEVPTIVSAVLSNVDALGSGFTGTVNDAYLNASETSSLIKVSGTGFELGDVVKVYDGLNVVGTATVDATAVASGVVLVSVLKSDLGVDGLKSLSVVATDVAGNTSTAPAPVAVTVDTEIATPVLSIPALNSVGASQNNLFDNASETYIELKIETAAGLPTFKAGDVIQLMQINDVNGVAVSSVLKHADNSPYAPITIATDGQTVNIQFLKADLPAAGNIKLGVQVNDAAANVASSATVNIGGAGLTISNAAMVANGVSAFDVNSDIVLIASAALDPAGVAGKFITFTNTAITDGFAGQGAQNSFTVDVTDTRFVTVDAAYPTRIIIKPPFDFDFSSAYTVSIDAGAFQVSGGGLSNLAVTPTHGLNFNTVAVGGNSVVLSNQGQKFNADGTVALGKKWINADLLGDPSAPASLNLTGGDYVLVVKDRDASGASPVVNSGVGVLGTHVNVNNWGPGDAIYVDDQGNDKSKINQNSQTELWGRNASQGILNTVRLDAAGGANTQEAMINILSLENNAVLTDAALDAQLRGQINVSNTRFGTAVTAVRTDTENADPLVVGSNIAPANPAIITLTGNFRAGDVIDLVFYNNANQAVTLTTPVQKLVPAGFTGNSLTINVNSFDGLVNGQRYSVTAKVTDIDAAVTFSPALVLTFRNSVTPPVLSLDASNDSVISNGETTILLNVAGNTLHIGDRIELQLAGGTITTGVSATAGAGNGSNIVSGFLTVTANEIINGIIYTVNSTSLPNGSNDVTLRITDSAGNTAVTLPADKLVITQPSYQNISGLIGFGPVIAGNDLSAKAYDAAGNLLGEDTTVDAGGAYTILIRSDYVGAVLIEITSSGANTDFVDEHLGQNTDLSSYTLRAVTSAPGVSNLTAGAIAPNAITTNITNLTDLAAKKLLGTNAKLITSVTTAQVTAINTQVAEKFLGVNADVTTETFTFTVNANGTSNAANANRYGQVLKQLSDLASTPDYGGNINYAQSAVAQQITWTPAAPNTAASLGADVQKLALLAKVALNADATTPPTGANVLSVQDLTDLGIANAAALTQARKNELIADIAASNSATIGNVVALQTLTNKITGNGRILDLADGVSGATAPTAADYLAAGVTGVTAANLAAVNTRVADSSAAALPNALAIKAIADAGAAAFTASVAKLEAFEGNGQAPTLADYVDAGVLGVTAANLAAVNARLANAVPGAAVAPSQLQAIAVAGAAAQSLAFLVLLSYKNDPSSNPVPTVNTLRDLGVVGVTTPSGVDAVKTFLLNNSVSASSLPTVVASQITSAVLPTLRPSQVAGMTPGQLVSLTPAQIALLPAAVVAVLSPAQVQALLAVGQLSADQVKALPAESLAQLSAAQLAVVAQNLSPAQQQAVVDIQAGAAITTNAAAGLTPAGINALSPASISGLSPEALGNLGAAALQSLDAAQVAAITPAQAAQISAAQINNLLPDQVVALSPSAVGALNASALQSLDAGQMAAITPAQAAQISSAQIDALNAAQLALLTPAALAALSPAALGSLDVLQVAQMSALQIDALSPAQVAAITPAAVAGLSAAALGSLDASQLAAMSPAQLDALTPVQVTLLPAAALSLLSPAQLIALDVVDSAQQAALVEIAAGAAITPSAAALLGSVDILAMSPAKLASLSPAAIANLGAGALGSLNASQMAVITAAQAANLSATQIDALLPAQLAELSPAAVGALSATAVASFDSNQLLTLTPAQAAQLTAAQIDALSPTQVAALSPASVAVLSNEALGSLNVLQMAALTPLQAAQISALQVDALGSAQIAALTPLAFDQLNDAALASLDAQQVGAITAAQIDTLSTTNIEALVPSVVAALSALATASLSNDQVAAMSLDQLSALTVAQKLAMFAANQFNGLSNNQIDSLNSPPVVSGGSFSAISKPEDSDNTVAVSLGLNSMIYSAGELGQTLGFSITAIPAFVTLWKADGLTQVTTATVGLTQAEIQGLMYKTVADANGSGTITWTVTDSGSPPRTLTQSLNVTVSATDDAPTATNLSAEEGYTEETAIDLNDIVVTDLDSADVTVTLTLSNLAAGALNTANSGSVTSDYNAVTGVWTAAGAKADVNTLLAALTFTPALNFNGSFIIATSVSDGTTTVTGSKAFTGTATDDAPTLVQPSSLSFTNTSAVDSFSSTGATLSATDVEGSALTYGLANGVAGSTVISSVTYDISRVGTYGTLYLVSSTGAYLYVPTVASINALSVAASESFTVNVTDGNSTTAQTLTVNVIDRVAPASLDLIGTLTGVQTTSTRITDNLAIQSGVAFVSGMASSSATDIASIKMTLGGALDTFNDKLVLDVDTSIASNVASLTNKTIGGVTGLSYSYDATTKVLTVSKTDGSAITGAQTKSIAEGIQLKNTQVTPAVGIRTADWVYTDASGNDSVTSTATLNVGNRDLAVDLDAAVSGTQTSVSRNATLVSTLNTGLAFVTSVAVPSTGNVTSISLKLSGTGLDTTNDKLVLDVDTSISATFASLTNKTIGSVTGLSYDYNATTKTLNISKSDASVIAVADVQSIIGAIKLKNVQAAIQDGLRTADIQLNNAAGSGVASSATINVDTTPPVIDLDSSVAAAQLTASRNITLSSINSGADIVDTSKLTISSADDTKVIKIVLSGAALDTTNDKLVLDADLSLGTTLATVNNKIIGGVAGLSYGYDSVTNTLTLSRTDSAVLSSLEVKAILSAIKLKDTAVSVANGARVATITLDDLAGLTSAAAVSTMNIDSVAPTTLSSAIVVANQKAFGLVNVGDILGTTNPHNLSSGESATLTALIPSGFTATSFLAAIRGVNNEWGGFSVNGASNNNTSSSKQTFQKYVNGVTSGAGVDYMFQDGDFVKGQTLTFTETSGALTLSAGSGGVTTFYVPGRDMYRFLEGSGSKTAFNFYEAGAIKILYQFDTANVDTTPTINVTYDGTKASVGDVIQLFEGNTLLGSRTLTLADVGVANTTLGVDVLNSLPSGIHNIVSKYTDTAGNTVSGSALPTNIVNNGVAPTVTNVQVSGDGGSTKITLNDSLTTYAVVSQNTNFDATKQLTFTGTVSTDSIVSVSMAGQQIAFGKFVAGNFTLTTGGNILKPGYNDDLTFSVTDATSGASAGQTTVIANQKLGWYYSGQDLGNVTGGAGSDLFMLGSSQSGSTVQTGAGNDVVTVGGFARTNNLSKSISDFTLGTDVVKVNGQTVTNANLSSFVTASASGSNTQLVIDLDGAGAGSTTYSLTLTGLTYNAANVATIFGV